jgi:hypothetical protein
MTKKLLFVATLMLVVVFGALAADISGKWTSEQAGRNGGAPRVTTYNFKVDGNKLTGDMTAPGRGGAAGTAVTISDGKVDGNNVSFKVTRETPNGSMSSEYKGTINGDTIELETSRPGQDGTPMTMKMTLKRATT